MKILFLGKAHDEASVRYRVLPVMQCLEREGHDTQFMSSDLSVWQKLRLLTAAPTYDLVFIQRKLFSGFFLRLLRRRAKRIAFDYDDAIFVKSSGENSNQRMSRFTEVCRSSELILAGNQHLAKQAESLRNPATRLEWMPTSVETRRYFDNSTKKDDVITLVWIGSRSTRRYLDMLIPVLERLGKAHDNLQLKVVSDFDYQLDSLPVKNVRWDQAGEIDELVSSHIGIAPMLDNAWTRGKCALKVLQYMAAGLPVVSSNCGANSEVVSHNHSGFLVGSEDEWCDSIDQLVHSESMRDEMGVVGQRIVSERYDLERNSERTSQLISTLVG